LSNNPKKRSQTAIQLLNDLRSLKTKVSINWKFTLVILFLILIPLLLKKILGSKSASSTHLVARTLKGKTVHLEDVGEDFDETEGTFSIEACQINQGCLPEMICASAPKNFHSQNSYRTLEESKNKINCEFRDSSSDDIFHQKSINVREMFISSTQTLIVILHDKKSKYEDCIRKNFCKNKSDEIITASFKKEYKNPDYKQIIFYTMWGDNFSLSDEMHGEHFVLQQENEEKLESFINSIFNIFGLRNRTNLYIRKTTIFLAPKGEIGEIDKNYKPTDDFNQKQRLRFDNVLESIKSNDHLGLSVNDSEKINLQLPKFKLLNLVSIP
jgi:hypothetical protein